MDLRTREIALQRRVTAEFLKTRPEYITITPHEDRRTASGATSLVALAPLYLQTGRLVEVDTTGAPLVTVDGVQRTIEWMLVGPFDAQFPVHGSFVARGFRWTIEHTYPFNDYEVRVGVVQRGSAVG